jgi:hypothetical protein
MGDTEGRGFAHVCDTSTSKLLYILKFLFERFAYRLFCLDISHDIYSCNVILLP